MAVPPATPVLSARRWARTPPRRPQRGSTVGGDGVMMRPGRLQCHGAQDPSDGTAPLRLLLILKQYCRYSVGLVCWWIWRTSSAEKRSTAGHSAWHLDQAQQRQQKPACHELMLAITTLQAAARAPVAGVAGRAAVCRRPGAGQPVCPRAAPELCAGALFLGSRVSACTLGPDDDSRQRTVCCGARATCNVDTCL
jgi:hypothetical protein